MFEMLEGKDDIAAAQQTLEKTLISQATSTVERMITSTRYKRPAEVLRYGGRHWSWSGLPRSAVPKCWLNFFGVVSEKPEVNIGIQINIPMAGRNNGVAGFFARELASGQVFLMHSGVLGGSKNGVGRAAFVDASGLELIKVAVSKGRPRPGIIVMPVAGENASTQGLKFVDAVVHFKDEVRPTLKK